jgi:hypothetical protein|tara:strand:- start:394 stop:789 length:396 start_codon:yes stop_codon:yes gene_type:complete
MKKSELKKVIKPLVKECIQEVLLEEGLLSNVVSEVVKGMGAAPIVEQKQSVPKQIVRQPNNNTKLKEQRRKLMDAINKDAYNGVDLFEGTTPTPAQREQQAGSVDLGDPSDAGVDISSIMGVSSKIWEKLK